MLCPTARSGILQTVPFESPFELEQIHFRMRRYNSAVAALRRLAFSHPVGTSAPVHNQDWDPRDKYDAHGWQITVEGNEDQGFGGLVSTVRLNLPHPSEPLLGFDWTKGKWSPPPKTAFVSRGSTHPDLRWKSLCLGAAVSVGIRLAHAAQMTHMGAIVLAPLVEKLRVHGFQVVGGERIIAPGDGHEYSGGYAVLMELNAANLERSWEAARRSFRKLRADQYLPTLEIPLVSDSVPGI